MENAAGRSRDLLGMSLAFRSPLRPAGDPELIDRGVGQLSGSASLLPTTLFVEALTNVAAVKSPSEITVS